MTGTNTKRDGTFENQYDKSIHEETDKNEEKTFVEDLWGAAKPEVKN